MALIDTSKVANRRVVRLNSIEELAAEAERILAAARQRRVKRLGNWAPGQILQHLGRCISYSIHEFPYQYPWKVRLASRLAWWQGWTHYVAWAVRPGFQNPPEAACVEPNDVVDLDLAAEHFRAPLEELRAGAKMTQRSPTGELLTHEQWVEFHLRHAELHFSFLLIEDKP